MHLVRALEEIEKRQGVKFLEFGESHVLEEVVTDYAGKKALGRR
jgi:hypothetical protein